MSTRAELCRSTLVKLNAKHPETAETSTWLGFPLYITDKVPVDCIVIADEYGNVYDTIRVNP